MWQAFAGEYLDPGQPALGAPVLAGRCADRPDTEEGSDVTIHAVVRVEGDEQQLSAGGNGRSPLSLTRWPGSAMTCECSTMRNTALSAGDDARAAAYVRCAVGERVVLGSRYRLLDRHRLTARGGVGGQPGQPVTPTRPPGATEPRSGRGHRVLAQRSAQLSSDAARSCCSAWCAASAAWLVRRLTMTPMARPAKPR